MSQLVYSAVLGALVGDIVGSRFEFDNLKSKDFDLFAPACSFTDDSVMTLAIARALMEAERFRGAPDGDERLSEEAVRWMRRIGRDYPDCGFGGRFRAWMFGEDPRPYGSWGNGAAMRISAVGMAAGSPAELKRMSRAVTAPTHNHPEGIRGAEAAAMAIYLARKGCGKQEIRAHIEKEYYALNFTLDGIRPSYRFEVSCQGSVPQAIESFLEAESFEDCIRCAISIGGDSDTIAAIAGGIAGAHWGVPRDIGAEALARLDPQLHQIYSDWAAFCGVTRENTQG